MPIELRRGFGGPALAALAVVGIAAQSAAAEKDPQATRSSAELAQCEGLNPVDRAACERRMKGETDVAKERTADPPPMQPATRGQDGLTEGQRHRSQMSHGSNRAAAPVAADESPRPREESEAGRDAADAPDATDRKRLSRRDRDTGDDMSSVTDPDSGARKKQGPAPRASSQPSQEAHDKENAAGEPEEKDGG